MKRRVINRIGYLVAGVLLAASIIGNSAVKTFSDEIVQTTSIYTYDDLCGDIGTLAVSYPENIVWKSIGTTLEGRMIPMVILGNKDKAKHFVFVQSTLHAREYMGSQMLMKMVEYYAMNPSLLRDTCFYIVPMANPDGVCIVQTGAASCTNTDYIQFVNGQGHTSQWKANARGVDLNRNWNACWEYVDLRGYTAPSYEFWKGYAPETEPEVLAMKQASTEKNFELFLNIHQQGNIIYCGSDLAAPEINAASNDWAGMMKQINGYRICGTGNNGKLSYGTFADYVCQSLGKPSVTLEVGSGLPPKAQGQFNKYYQKNYRIFEMIANNLSK